MGNLELETEIETLDLLGLKPWIPKKKKRMEFLRPSQKNQIYDEKLI